MRIRCWCCGQFREADPTPEEKAHMAAEDSVRDIFDRLAALEGEDTP